MKRSHTSCVLQLESVRFAVRSQVSVYVREKYGRYCCLLSSTNRQSIDTLLKNSFSC
jgi:hypothetical protein